MRRDTTGYFVAFIPNTIARSLPRNDEALALLDR
jgi:hypothetical protein